MASLTPANRADEVTSQAMNEGLMSGTMVFIPSLGALYAAMQNPKFVKLTNWQSRTAMVLMPALFAFGFTSENKLIHRMHEVADETEHAIASVEWADREQRRKIQDAQRATMSMMMLKDPVRHKAIAEKDEELRTLYRQSILENGHVRLVESDNLGPHHKVANFVQDNPIKVLAGVGIPTVGAIFMGRNGKAHLSLQMKLLHTRVMGQFAVLCTLLSVMAVKGFMDSSGKFVTEAEINEKVENMVSQRHLLIDRLEYQAQQDEKERQEAKQLAALHHGKAHAM
jgi:hypothetical protein